MSENRQRIRVLFYKSKLGDGHIIDNLISWYTGLFNWGTKPYSHCEIWVPFETDQGKCRFESVYHIYGQCYTSTMRGDNNGVVKRPASEVLKNPGRWDYYEVEIKDWDCNRMIGEMDNTVNMNSGYDIATFLKFFNPFKRESTFEQFICSEFVQWALYQSCIFEEYELLSPRRLSKRLNKMGYRAKSLRDC